MYVCIATAYFHRNPFLWHTLRYMYMLKKSMLGQLEVAHMLQGARLVVMNSCNTGPQVCRRRAVNEKSTGPKPKQSTKQHPPQFWGLDPPVWAPPSSCVYAV